ncbi:MAG TPA: tetratricopeptide repeat protein [Candidatus Obscuribacterales bacterium]
MAETRKLPRRLLITICIGALLGGFGGWLGSTKLRTPRPSEPAESARNHTGGSRYADYAVWQRLTSAGEKALQAGKSEEAERLFLSALREAEKFGQRDPRLLLTLHKLSDVYRTMGKYAQADSFDKRIEAFEQRY